MDYNSTKNDPRTDADQSETRPEFRGSFESRPGMMRPDLPIGSPERAAYFAALRPTFVEDWKAAEIAAERDRLSVKGDLYFIRAGNAVKIGHTVNIVNRLGKMQADNHEKLDCLLILRGRGHEERDWHERFEHQHIRGEWFKWSAEIERVICEARSLQAA